MQVRRRPLNQTAVQRLQTARQHSETEQAALVLQAASVNKEAMLTVLAQTALAGHELRTAQQHKAMVKNSMQLKRLSAIGVWSRSLRA